GEAAEERAGRPAGPGAASPGRPRADPPLVRRRDPTPARREVALVLAALLAHDHEQPLADRLELALTAVEDAVAPLEAELEADVHQLEQILVGLRVLGQAREELEELLAAAGLAVEHRQEALLRPRSGGSERRARRGLVDQGAERVARCHDLLVRHSRGPRLRLELPDALGETVAERGRVRMLD